MEHLAPLRSRLSAIIVATPQAVALTERSVSRSLGMSTYQSLA